MRQNKTPKIHRFGDRNRCDAYSFIFLERKKRKISGARNIWTIGRAARLKESWKRSGQWVCEYIVTLPERCLLPSVIMALFVNAVTIFTFDRVIRDLKLLLFRFLRMISSIRSELGLLMWPQMERMQNRSIIFSTSLRTGGSWTDQRDKTWKCMYFNGSLSFPGNRRW